LLTAPIANLKKQSKVLQTHLSAFGANIARDNYQSQTASVRNIIDDWDTKPELKEAISAFKHGP
jgi:hypothetical protein